MPILLKLFDGLSESEHLRIKTTLVGWGLAPRPSPEEPTLWEIGEPDPALQVQVVQLWGVDSLFTLDGRLRLVGRRRFSEFALPKLIAGLGILTMLFLLAGWFPVGLGEAPDLRQPPAQLRPDWYLMFIHVVFTHIPQGLGFLGPLFLAGGLAALLAWPFIERSPETQPRRRPLAVALGAVTVAVMVLLTLYGYFSFQ